MFFSSSKDSTIRNPLKNISFLLSLVCLLISAGCVAQHDSTRRLLSGAEQVAEYLPLLKNKNIAVVANQTSMIGTTHLVDSLLGLKLNVVKVFAPEHGFRGNVDAGEHINSSTDSKTGLPIVSLYGSHNRPVAKDLENVDVVIYDIQDVGVRFYTYISTMQYVMEACAEYKKEFVVFDRPNPNGFYIDGPVLEPKFRSFVGLAPVPVVYALTPGEYAMMLNGEKWLKDSLHCNLQVIKLENYSHKDYYSLPVKPSPNLPNMSSVYLYPSLGLFEGTNVSVGRGTDIPFQVVGHPAFSKGNYKFVPRSIPGAAKNPPFLGDTCKGFDLSALGENYFKDTKALSLKWLKLFYQDLPNKKKFFNSYFNTLAGTAKLKQQVIDGLTEDEIRKSWQPDIDKYKKIRIKYLLYPDFEDVPENN